MRGNIKNITNELANGQGLDFDLLECYNAIFEYCRKTGTLGTARKNVYEINNGMLIINGKNILRVAPLPKRFTYDDKADFWEGKILARQEAWEN